MDDLQRKKLARLFTILDRDHDGAVEQADYGVVGQQAAAVHGWAAGSAEYAAMEQRMADYWTTLRQAADPNNDQRISRDEWLQVMERRGEVLHEVRAQMVALAAAFLDRDGDGYITPEDYAQLFQRLGHDFAASDGFFRRLDRDGDGRIDQAELGMLVDQFFSSTDPEAPGNGLLGPL